MPPAAPLPGTIVRLAPVPLTITAAADAPAAPPAAGGGGDGERRRTITGQAVPYGEAAVTAGDGVAYRFRAGSLRAARERVPVLLSHDMSRPVGVLAALTETAAGADVELSIDATPDGDHALIQARSGSRAGISVGAAPLVFTLDGDVIEVSEAELHEISLVPLSAYPTATVTNVQASTPTGGPTMPPETTPAAPPPPVVNGAPPPAVTAASPPPPTLELVPARSVIVAEPPARRITATEYVSALIRAGGDPVRAAELIQAAVPPVGHLADVPGALPPTYTTEVLGGVPTDRPLFGICNHRPLPASGMQINKPEWGTLPDGGWMADDTAAPAYNVATITLKPVAIAQWAWATGYSIAVQERTSPDYVDSVYQQAVANYYLDVETKIAALMAANAAAAGTIGGGIAAVFSATKRSAGVLVLAPDVFGEMVDAEGALKYAAASVSGGMSGSVAGLSIVVAPVLAAGDIYVGIRGAIEARESTPLRLTATAISGMNGELGVTSFASFDLEIPGAFAKCAAIGPVVAAPGSSSSSRSGR
jgi:HK97 family phage prohead protease